VCGNAARPEKQIQDFGYESSRKWGNELRKGIDIKVNLQDITYGSADWIRLVQRDFRFHNKKD
jgi:hypothetical protein